MSSPYRGTGMLTHLPPVTRTIVLVCIVVWIAQLLVPGLNRLIVLSPALGAEQPWRFLTSAFAHSTSGFAGLGGITHIAMNMLALIAVGHQLEPLLGAARFLALYLLSALGGGVGFVLLSFPYGSFFDPSGSNWFTGVVGASGAVFGLFGAMVVLQRKAGGATSGLWSLLAINAVIAFLVPGIAWQAHVGGLFTGLAVAAVLGRGLMRQPRGEKGSDWVLVMMIGVLLVILLVVKYALV